MTTMLAPDAQLTPAAPKPRRTGAGFGGGMTALGQPATQSFGADSNLIGTQINPTNSAVTNGAQNDTTAAGNAYNSFALKPFQGVQPLNLGTERGMLDSANSQMSQLGYNFKPANASYDTATTQQQTAMGAGQGYLNQAASMAGGAGGSTNGGNGYNQADDVARARAMTMQNLEGLNGPDRNALANESLALLEARSQPGYEQSLRSVNQKAAAMGRRGSGVTTNELGDVTLARERELALARRDLANTSASETLNDRLQKVNASQGVTQGFGGLDQSAANINDTAARASSAFSQQNADRQLSGANLLRGIGNDTYGMGKDASNLSMAQGDRYGDQARDTTGLMERKAGFTRGIANDRAGLGRDEYGAAVNERDAGRADEYNQGNFLGNRFDRNAGYLSQNQGQDRANRNELRGERGYQYGLSRDAVGDEMDRMGFEESLRNGRYNRASGTARLGFDAPSPTGAYQGAADRAGADAQDYYGAIGEFAGAYGNRRRPSATQSGATGQYYTGPNSDGFPVYG